MEIGSYHRPLLSKKFLCIFVRITMKYVEYNVLSFDLLNPLLIFIKESYKGNDHQERIPYIYSQIYSQIRN